MTKTVEQKPDDLENFFTEEGLNNTIQLRIENVPVGSHRLKLLGIDLKKGRINEKTKIAGKDRIECLFEYVSSNVAKCVKGSKGTIPYFKDVWQFGEKGLVKFAQQGMGDETPITGKQAIQNIRECIGLEIDCVVTVKEKAGEVLKNKKGEAINDYNFSTFYVE